MIHHCKIFLASALMRGIRPPPRTSVIWNSFSGWMPLITALARNMATALQELRQNHKRNQNRPSVRSLFCGSKQRQQPSVSHRSYPRHETLKVKTSIKIYYIHFISLSPKYYTYQKSFLGLVELKFKLFVTLLSYI